MKNKIVLLLLIVTYTNTVFAQKKVFEGLRNYTNSGSGPIMEDRKLVGYFSFLQYDKVDRKHASYQLNFMDDNLNTVKSIDLVRLKDDYLVETVFNGTAFLCVFFNDKEGLELITYDQSGKQIGNIKEEEVSKMDKYRIMGAQQSEEAAANATIYPLGSTGFIRQTFLKNDKYGYEVSRYDNNLKKSWSFGSDPASKMLEFCNVEFSNDEYVVLTVARKTTMMTKEYDTFIMLIDGKTGKKLFEKPMKDKNEFSLLGVFVDEKASEIVMFGEYYPIGKEVLKSRSEGVFAMSVDFKGNELKKNKMSWSSDIKNIIKRDKLSEKDEDDIEDKRVFFHKVYKAKDGRIFAIGEQFKRSTSVGGVASKLTGGGASTAQLVVENMVCLELSKDLTLNNYFIYPKKKTRVALPAGIGLNGTAVLALYVKSTGGFDYSFSTVDVERDLFVSIYQDYDRDNGKEDKKADVMVGTIKYQDGKLTNSKTPISSDAYRFWLRPAKPGYIEITEYFKKKKMLTMRLEKMAY